MKRVGVWIVSLVALLCMAGSAEAWRGNGKGWENRAERARAVLSELNLTEEQKAKVKELFTQHREKVKGWREKMRELRERLRAELMSGQEEKAEAIVQEMVKTYENLVRERVRYTLEMKKILSAEQFKKWQEIRQKRRGRGRRNRVNFR